MNIIAFLHLPPPKTGAATMNKELLSILSELTEDNDIYVLDISVSKKHDSINRISFIKIIRIIFNYFKAIRLGLNGPFDVSFVSVSSSRVGFFKEFFIVLISSLSANKTYLIFHNKNEFLKSKMPKFFGQIMGYKHRVTAIYLADSLVEEYNRLNQFIDHAVIPNGLNFNRRYQVKHTAEKVEFVFISNYYYFKGVYEAINIVAGLYMNGWPVSLRLYGNEGDISLLEIIDYINDNNLDHFVQVYGPIELEEKMNILDEADALLYPSQDDCLPLVVIEAMMRGLLVVASDVGAIPEMLRNGESGIILKGESTSERIHNLILEGLFNTQVRDRLRSNAFKDSEKYSIHNYRTRIRELLINNS